MTEATQVPAVPQSQPADVCAHRSQSLPSTPRHSPAEVSSGDLSCRQKQHHACHRGRSKDIPYRQWTQQSTSRHRHTLYVPLPHSSHRPPRNTATGPLHLCHGASCPAGPEIYTGALTPVLTALGTRNIYACGHTRQHPQLGRDLATR